VTGIVNGMVVPSMLLSLQIWEAARRRRRVSAIELAR
jgi:hypothetical protein